MTFSTLSFIASAIVPIMLFLSLFLPLICLIFILIHWLLSHLSISSTLVNTLVEPGSNHAVTSCSESSPKQAQVIMYLKYKSLENTAEKGKIAHNEPFLLFPQCFLPIRRTFCHFHQI